VGRTILSEQCVHVREVMRIVLKKTQLAVAVSVLFFASIAAHSQPQPSDTTLTTNPVFVKNCVKCHGANAQGRYFRGPSLTSKKVAATAEDELRNIITNGKGRMPKYKNKLGSDEINALVHQVKALNQK
jgi:mono/diheme cytochrome c family protein